MHPTTTPKTTSPSAAPARPLVTLTGLLLLASPAQAERAHPTAATVVVAVQTQTRGEPTIAAGVLINPAGLVITSQRLVADAAHVWVYLYHSDARSLPEPETFLRAHYKDALVATIERSDPLSDLALLRLPQRAAPYPVIEFGDAERVREGELVMALGRSASALVWSGAQRGLISEVRADAIINEASAGNCIPGGPLLNSEGKLVGVTVTPPGGVCVARPARLVRAFVSGDALPQSGERTIDSSRMLGEVSKRLVQKLGRPQAARALAELLAASGRRGRAAARVLGADAGKALNDAVAETARSQAFPPEDMITLAQERLPLLVCGNDGGCALRKGLKYQAIHASTLGGQPLAAAVDDRSGASYLVDAQGRVLHYDGQWRALGIPQALDVAASDGVVYTLLTSGKLLQRGPTGSRQILQQPQTGTLLATEGVLYLLTLKGELLRYRAGKWDGGGAPITTGLKQVVAQGATWFGLSQAGKIVAGDRGRFTELGDGATGLWMGGDKLIMLTRHNQIFEYSLQRARWSAVPF